MRRQAPARRRSRAIAIGSLRSRSRRWLAGWRQRLAIGTVKIWDAASGACAQTLEGHGDSIPSIAVSPDGRWLASGSNDQHCQEFWDAVHRPPARRRSRAITSISFDRGLARWPLAGVGVPRWYYQDLGCGDQAPARRRSRAIAIRISSIAVSPDGRWLASGSHDHTIRIWDAALGACTQTLEGHSDSITSIAVSPDGRWLASGSYDRTRQDLGRGVRRLHADAWYWHCG